MGVSIENETCGNCGRTIGKLESPFLWGARLYAPSVMASSKRQWRGRSRDLPR